MWSFSWTVIISKFVEEMGVVIFFLVVLNLVLERSWICLSCCNCMAESEDKIYTRCSAVYCRHFQWQLMWAPTQSHFSTILSTLDCVRSVQLARCFIFAIFELLLHFLDSLAVRHSDLLHIDLVSSWWFSFLRNTMNCFMSLCQLWSKHMEKKCLSRWVLTQPFLIEILT
jgi:hypothetical protein